MRTKGENSEISSFSKRLPSEKLATENAKSFFEMLKKEMIESKVYEINNNSFDNVKVKKSSERFFTNGRQEQIANRILEEGIISYKMLALSNYRELIILKKMYKAAQFETLKIMYIRENSIVGYEGLATKVPSTLVEFKFEDDEELLDNLCLTMHNLNADGYYLVHNHPEGLKIKPSNLDFEVTKYFKERLPGFRGHLIFDGNKRFSFITRKMSYFETDLTQTKMDYVDSGYSKTTSQRIISFKECILNNSIIDESFVLSTVTSFQNSKNFSLLAFTSSRNILQAIQEVPNDLVVDKFTFAKYIVNRVKEFNAKNVYMVTNKNKFKKFDLQKTENFIKMTEKNIELVKASVN